jgi:hypothetical protein
MLSMRADCPDLSRIANIFAAAGKHAPLALVRGINQTGDRVRTAMKRSLVGQSGLPSKTIHKALQKKSAYGSNFTYEINSRGGNISLKYFKAKETPQGVVAHPWASAHSYSHAFMKGGRFPNRKEAKRLGGHVFQRAGKRRLKINKVKSNLFIPTEMTSGATADTFYRDAIAGLEKNITSKLFSFIK